MCLPGGAGLLDIKPDLMESLMQVAAQPWLEMLETLRKTHRLAGNT